MCECVCVGWILTDGGRGREPTVSCEGLTGGRGLFISSYGRFVCGRRASAPADT